MRPRLVAVEGNIVQIAFHGTRVNADALVRDELAQYMPRLVSSVGVVEDSPNNFIISIAWSSESNARIFARSFAAEEARDQGVQ